MTLWKKWVFHRRTEGRRARARERSKFGQSLVEDIPGKMRGVDWWSWRKIEKGGIPRSPTSAETWDFGKVR